MRGTVVMDNVKDFTVAHEADGDTITVDLRDGDGVIVLVMTSEAAEALRRALFEPMELAPGLELYEGHVIVSVGEVAEARDCSTCNGTLGHAERTVTVSPVNDPETLLHFDMSCAAQERAYFMATHA